MTILKAIFSPVQKRLIDKHMCPACTRNLDKMIKREPLTQDTEKVTCECGRVFLYQRSHRKYTRFSKVSQIR